MLLRIGLISMVGSTLGQRRAAVGPSARCRPRTTQAATAKFRKSPRVYPSARALAACRLTGGLTSELQAEPRRQGIVAGILGMIAAVAGTATVWGIIQFLGAQRNLNTLNEHLAKLTEERKEYEALLEE